MTDTGLVAFTTDDAQRLTGLSVRRLQYWDETDFIRPSVAARRGRGSPRLYSFRDVVQLRIAAQLRDRVSLQALRRLKVALDVDAPFASIRFAISAGGETVYVGPPDQAESARTPGQVVMTFELPLDEIRADLQERIRKLRTRQHVGGVSRTRGVVGSKPVMTGTRITPGAIVAMLGDGWSRDRILDEFPDLAPADIDAAVTYARNQRRAG